MLTFLFQISFSSFFLLFWYICREKAFIPLLCCAKQARLRYTSNANFCFPQIACHLPLTSNTFLRAVCHNVCRVGANSYMPLMGISKINSNFCLSPTLFLLISVNPQLGRNLLGTYFFITYTSSHLFPKHWKNILALLTQFLYWEYQILPGLGLG